MGFPMEFRMDVSDKSAVPMDSPLLNVNNGEHGCLLMIVKYRNRVRIKEYYSNAVSAFIQEVVRDSANRLKKCLRQTFTRPICFIYGPIFEDVGPINTI